MLPGVTICAHQQAFCWVDVCAKFQIPTVDPRLDDDGNPISTRTARLSATRRVSLGLRQGISERTACYTWVRFIPGASRILDSASEMLLLLAVHCPSTLKNTLSGWSSYSKTHVAIDFDAYRLWRSQHRLQTTEGTSNPQRDITNSNTAFDASASPALEVSPIQPPAHEDAAPYPTSFSQIVDLITSGQPVPGIKEIPDTVLSGKESNPKTAKRKKPWENTAEQNEKVAGDAKSWPGWIAHLWPDQVELHTCGRCIKLMHNLWSCFVRVSDFIKYAWKN